MWCGEMTATPPALLRGRAREALSRSTSQRATCSSARSLEMHGLLFAASGTGVWLNTRTTPWAAADQKRKTMPADGCAICVQLSVFKPARLKSGALYGESVVGTSAVNECTPRLGR